VERQLLFHPDALREWRKLDTGIKSRLKRKLAQRLKNPLVPAARLSGKLSNCFKIRDQSSGYRLVYTFDEKELFVLVIAKRENLEAYGIAERRSR